MNVRLHRYQIPWSSSFSRSHTGEGVLLSVQHLGVWGYANLHPWTSLGDQPLDQQLAQWQAGDPSEAILLALKAAQRDAEARAHETVGVRFLSSIQNHFLFLEAQLNLEQVRDRIQSWSHRFAPPTAKWKLSPSQAAEAAQFLNAAAEMLPQLLWRLDANGLFSFEEIKRFWLQLSENTRTKIDYTEDPCPYHYVHWSDLEKLGMPLAIDFQINSWLNTAHRSSPTASQATTIVLKPAIQDCHKWGDWLSSHPHPVVITSYLDHPVGVLHTMWIAEDFALRLPSLLRTCGLSLPLSKSDLELLWPGLEMRADRQNSWSGVPSPGIGFQKQLESLAWKEMVFL